MSGLVQSTFADQADPCANEQSFELVKEETMQFIERAVVRIARADNVEIGLRELEAFLLHILGFVKRDPGLEIAAYDLYNAAAVIVVKSTRQLNGGGCQALAAPDRCSSPVPRSAEYCCSTTTTPPPE